MMRTRDALAAVCDAIRITVDGPYVMIDSRKT